MKNLDLSARFFKAILNLKRFLMRFVSTAYMCIETRLKGIKIGDNCSFCGLTILDRFKYSTIIIGNNCTFNSSVAFNFRGIQHCILHTATDFAKIEIGNDCGLSGVSIVAWKSVRIGNNVVIGADTCVGDTDDHPERLGTSPSPVEIKDNVFIGMHCIILKGVTIGENSIIGAGSVVTKDIPANCVAAGVPCKVIRILDK